MPELADVEGFRRVLAEHAAGRTIRRVRVYDDGVLHGTTPAALGRALHGRRFGTPRRHGKWLVAGTGGDGPTVLLHFGMTGSLHWSDDREGSAAVARFDRVTVVVDGGRLQYRDQRKLRGLWLARRETDVARITGELGPDAAAITRQAFAELLGSRGKRLKPLLMDQTALAGLGNLMVDEILWQARARPDAPARGLPEQQRDTVYAALRQVLDVSVRAGHVPARTAWLTGARDRPDGRCPRCGTALVSGTVGGRSTVWCPRCQR